MARLLYHKYAANLPIIDYHAHVQARDIYCNTKFDNLTQLWLRADHYKWRLMRAAGIAEAYITGHASDWEKFQAFSRVLPQAVGNPVYHWCHMELQFYFGCHTVLQASTARQIWTNTAQQLRGPTLGAQGMLAKSRVAYIGTTDDPADDLYWHRQWNSSPALPLIISPTYRPDRALDITASDWRGYLVRLANAAKCQIHDLTGLKLALRRTMVHFSQAGCRASDHGLRRLLFVPNRKRAAAATRKALLGRTITVTEAAAFQTELLLFCAKAYHQMDWAMQIHFNCMRNPNTRQYGLLGPDAGFDCIGPGDCRPLAALLDTLQRDHTLPRMVVYSLDGGDNAFLDTLLNSFPQKEAGWLQHGSAWWFQDHLQGICAQLESQAQQGLLANFIGMLTDSRSFSSYIRHDYFRRILCRLLGNWVAAGLYPPDVSVLGAMVQAICYGNACRFFRLPEQKSFKQEW